MNPNDEAALKCWGCKLSPTYGLNQLKRMRLQAQRGTRLHETKSTYY